MRLPTVSPMASEVTMSNLLLGASCAVLFALLASAPALGQQAPQQAAPQGGEIEEIVVTGSYIKGTPEDAALPVNVLSEEDLVQMGSPTITELLRDNPFTQGLIAETNQFDTRGGQGNEGVTTINLRGLGSSRTLVLINGKRHVATEGVGVDVSMIPMLAVQRLEVLKDGAAALYGSDAIGGVVNFITRGSFEGLELRASQQFIDDSHGDPELGLIAGYGGDGWNWVLAAEYAGRSELQIKDRDWALRAFPQNPEGGWSSIGNPGTFFNAATFASAPDPNCDALGGANQAGFCRFQFTQYDNLIEDSRNRKLFSELTYELGEHELHLEGLYSKSELDWKTSPAYPPQTLLAASNLVLPNHPGRIDFFAQNPAFAAVFGAAPMIYWGRYTGVAGRFGNPETADRDTEQWRAAARLSGTLFNGELDYDVSVTFSERERTLGDFHDMYVERFAFGMRGLGGPNCDTATGTPGVAPCEYYNPFSNAIQISATNGAVNPQFNPAVANSPELLNWLVGEGTSVVENRLLVWDAVLSGETDWELPGGKVGFAFGGQARREEYDLDVTSLFDLTVNPCPYTDPESITQGFTTSLDCGSPTGLFAFLSGTRPQDLDRTVYGAFAEFALPVTDTIDVQLALRFEDYGDETGSTLDPKIAARWQVNDWLALRGSASTTFRGPPQSALTGRVTALAFTDPALAFKAWDTVGNPDLDPESALATNIGVLLNLGGFSASIDYWRFDFEDPLQLESGTQIVNAYIANDCADGGTGVGTMNCDVLRGRIFPTGVAASSLERIERFVINGSDILTDGLDLTAVYAWSWGGVDLTLGAQASYTLSYESDDFRSQEGIFLAKGGDFVGELNEGTPFQTVVELKGNLFARASVGPHTATYTLRYTDDYEDVKGGVVSTTLPRLRNIDAHTTHDFTYILELFEGNTRFSFSVFNIFDEDPPPVSNDLNYDPYMHSPFGRMFKLGITQTF